MTSSNKCMTYMIIKCIMMYSCLVLCFKRLRCQARCFNCSKVRWKYAQGCSWPRLGWADVIQVQPDLKNIGLSPVQGWPVWKWVSPSSAWKCIRFLCKVASCSSSGSINHANARWKVFEPLPLTLSQYFLYLSWAGLCALYYWIHAWSSK